MRDMAVLRDFHEQYFDYQIRVRICVSFITALHPLTGRALALVKVLYAGVRGFWVSIRSPSLYINW